MAKKKQRESIAVIVLGADIGIMQDGSGLVNLATGEILDCLRQWRIQRQYRPMYMIPHRINLIGIDLVDHHVVHKPEYMCELNLEIPTLRRLVFKPRKQRT